jgi:sialate O-acetylesterase
MALSLREKNDVPVGLIQTAVEGTPVKAWCSEETIRHMGFYTDELEKNEKMKTMFYVRRK